MHGLVNLDVSHVNTCIHLHHFIPFIRTVDVKAGIKVVSHRLQMVRLIDGSLSTMRLVRYHIQTARDLPYERKSKRLLIRFIVWL